MATRAATGPVRFASTRSGRCDGLAGRLSGVRALAHLEPRAVRRVPAEVSLVEALDLRHDEEVEAASRRGRHVHDGPGRLVAEGAAVDALPRERACLARQVGEGHAALEDPAVV